MEKETQAKSIETFGSASNKLINCGRYFHSKGWLFATSGNLSAVVSQDDLSLAITRSGADKGNLSSDDILLIDSEMRVLSGTGIPSSETMLHLTAVDVMNAGAVFHTHSVWATILSDTYCEMGWIELRGYEMLKALKDVSTHEHSERIPIFENSQDMRMLSKEVRKTMLENRGIHSFLLRGHGLYSWGDNIIEARKTVEALEFLLEARGRIMQFKNIK